MCGACSPRRRRCAPRKKRSRSALTIAAALRPRFQTLLYRVAGAGNEQAIPAPGGWLFFRKDLDYVNGKPFPRPDRASGQGPDRNRPPPILLRPLSRFTGNSPPASIRLLAVPVPVKPCIEAHRFNPAAQRPDAFRQNPSYSAWLKALEAQGVSALDPTPLLHERAQRTGEATVPAHRHPLDPGRHGSGRRGCGPQHPASNGPGGAPTRRRATPCRSPHTATRSRYSDWERTSPSSLPRRSSSVPCRKTAMSRKPAQEADVLLLGDSFSNIYSLGAMGWGEGAGFPERLGAHLGRPVDAIVRNSDGAFATRQTLQKELASGNDRLRGKKVVVWEFAARELAFGNWKSLPLPEGEPAGRLLFLSSELVTKQRVRGVVGSAAPSPTGGRRPVQRAHRRASSGKRGAGRGGRGTAQRMPRLHLEHARAAAHGRRTPSSKGTPSLWSSSPWEDVSESLEKFQRSELEEPALLLEPPTWADASPLAPL
jgi:hypothetical protein